MQDGLNILDIIRHAIENEMSEYSEKLHTELAEKYQEEFNKRIYEQRRKVVLDVCKKIEIGHMFDPRNMQTNITIKL